jgi:hypothetical protein
MIAGNAQKTRKAERHTAMAANSAEAGLGLADGKTRGLHPAMRAAEDPGSEPQLNR